LGPETIFFDPIVCPKGPVSDHWWYDESGGGIKVIWIGHVNEVEEVMN
jgi:hypothetical protein